MCCIYRSCPGRSSISFGPRSEQSGRSLTATQHCREQHKTPSPDDMQVLISEIVSATDYADLLSRIEEHSFVLHSLPLSLFSRMRVFTDYRDQKYALEMVGAELPPVVVCGAKLIDGRHRVWVARKQGLTEIQAIDLDEVGFSYDYRPVCTLLYNADPGRAT